MDYKRQVEAFVRSVIYTIA